MSLHRASGRGPRPGIVVASAVAVFLALAAFTSTTSAQVFGPRTDLNTGAVPRNVALGDVDGDGHLDIVVTVQGAGLVSIFRGNGDLTFKPRIDVPVHDQPIALAVVTNDRSPGPPPRRMTSHTRATIQTPAAKELAVSDTASQR